MKYFVLACALLFMGEARAQRVALRINNDWEFSKEKGQEAPVPVQIPHTWNAADVMDDTPGYYRDKGTYRKIIHIQRRYPGEQFHLLLEGANQVAQVMVNGKKAGEHIGGYAAFYVPITHLVQDGENKVEVQVNNAHDPDIPPLSADFTFYGGLYRDVWMIRTAPVHFSFSQQTKGVRISTPLVNNTKALVVVTAFVRNNTAAKKVKVRSTLYDQQAKFIRKTEKIILVDQEQQVEMNLDVMRPNLWSPEDPYLYRLVTEIRDAANDQPLDRIEQPVGLRYFHFDANTGFFLNGKPYKLVGTSRHQDRPGMGNAVPDELAVADVALIKQMGGNFLRVAHYPQDPSVLAACDSLGILASVEIPVVNEITESAAFFNNCLNMQREMIRQHYNHPSVIIWCYMNEVLLRGRYDNEPEKKQQYLRSIRQLAQSLDSLTRSEDPSRYTMMAHHADYQKYLDVGLVEIPMIVGWNLYSGWYGGKLSDFPAFLDNFHTRHPDKILVVSEYGADADPRISSLTPVRFDKSVEYTTQFHQAYLKAMLERPFVASAMVWNLADFNSETRTETMPHINNKGLLTWDRTPKDPYYYYQAILSAQPVLKLLGVAKGRSIARYIRKQWQVATNLQRVELWVDGISQGERTPENGICSWEISVDKTGKEVEAMLRGYHKGKLVTEQTRLLLMPAVDAQQYFQLTGEMNVLLGAKRYFTDDAGRIWVPAQEYRTGQSGYVGGKTFRIPNNNRLPYGTDKNIQGTDNDPIYQTQQTGISAFKAQVPAGQYELVLHFAELLGGTVAELPYNLNDPERIEPGGKRIFDVWVNGQPFLQQLDIATQYGRAIAVEKKIRVHVLVDQGIEISFKPVEGEPVLNAIQVRRVSNQD